MYYYLSTWYLKKKKLCGNNFNNPCKFFSKTCLPVQFKIIWHKEPAQHCSLIAQSLFRQYLLWGDNTLLLSPNCSLNCHHVPAETTSSYVNTHCTGIVHRCHRQEAGPEKLHAAVFGVHVCRLEKRLHEIRSTEMQQRMKIMKTVFYFTKIPNIYDMPNILQSSFV